MPTRGLTVLACNGIFYQTLPFGEPAALQLYADFERALYAAL
jgi:hypothetical protein